MLRKSHEPWWRRLLAAEVVPARGTVERRCPECSHAYEPRERYCGRCHAATPEWRYG